MMYELSTIGSLVSIIGSAVFSSILKHYNTFVIKEIEFMKGTFSVILFLRRDKKKSYGTCPVMCRITVDKEETRFSNKIHIKEARWNTKANKASGSSQESKSINAILDDIKASLHRIYHNLQRFDIVTAEKIKGEF